MKENKSIQLSLILENKKSKFKDQCDKCKKFAYCKGHCGQVLCPKCINEE